MVGVAGAHFMDRDVISMQDFTKDEILAILEVVADVKQARHNPSFDSVFEKKYGVNISDLFHKVKIATLFRENSTRTFYSFRAAVGDLEGFVDGFPSDDYTSSKKGETWARTAGMFAGWGYDAIVTRTTTEGMPRWTKEYLVKYHQAMVEKHHARNLPFSYRVPLVVNGGDGKNQHPTQCFLDLFTIWELATADGRELDGLDIALLNDLKYGRTNASLMSVAHLFDWKLHFAYPDRFGPQQHRLEDLLRNGVNIADHGRNFKEAMAAAFIAYHSRPQKERVGAGEDLISIRELGQINKAMYEALGHNAPYLLHPLPIDADIFEEISHDLDFHEKNMTDFQASNGLYVRVALLALGLGIIRPKYEGGSLSKDLVEMKLQELDSGDGKDKPDNPRSGYIDGDGVVIDHIPPGLSRRLDGVLGFEGSDLPVIPARNMPVNDGRMPVKDMLKIHCYYDFDYDQLEAIALIAPEATINYVSGGKVVKKIRPVLGNHILDRITCGNSACVTNVEKEHATPLHYVEGEGNKRVVRCHFCEVAEGLGTTYRQNRFRYLKTA